MRVLIIVTHLLGTGHLARALNLARAYQRADHEVLVISGGFPVPLLDHGEVQILQLPPLRSAGVDFTSLLGDDDRQASPALFRKRQQLLLQILVEHKPDILITELFPFGRRILKNEFTALLQAAHGMSPRPLICASVRDILAPPSKPAKAELAETLIQRLYDGVLVHSDPDLVPLSLSWPVTEALQPFLHYTGFVAPEPAGPHPDGLGHGEILVSAGGSDVGAHLFEAALGAALLDPDLRWRLLIGGSDAKAQSTRISDIAPANLHAEPARPDFRQMLNHTLASVSLCGYNTALDILQAGTKALFVPFDQGGEVEQSLRAKALSSQNGIGCLSAANLFPDTLLASLKHVLQAPNRPARKTGFAGAAETVRITIKMKDMPR